MGSGEGKRRESASRAALPGARLALEFLVLTAARWGEVRWAEWEVIEAALAHVVRKPVEAAYARSDLFERRRRLMDDWAGYLAGPSRGPQAGAALDGRARRGQRGRRRNAKCRGASLPIEPLFLNDLRAEMASSLIPRTTMLPSEPQAKCEVAPVRLTSPSLSCARAHWRCLLSPEGIRRTHRACPDSGATRMLRPLPRNTAFPTTAHRRQGINKSL